MKRMLTILAMGLLCGFSCARSAERVSEVTVYKGMSDASGAVPLGNRFFAVADDESNPLRIYRRDAGGPPVQVVDLSDFLGTDPKSNEADWEAGTLMGNRAFWIGSHGANRNGKNKPSRHRLFATDIQMDGDNIKLIPVGKPCQSLLSDLINAPQLSAFDFSNGADKAPKTEGALNIEGLCATPDKQLLIGFRNPIPEGKALIVPLKNPDDVVFGKPAQLGDPILLDLGGLGIRDIAYYDGTYVIIGGSYHEGGPFKLFFWKGPGHDPKHIKHLSFKGLNPEAILIYPDKGLNEIQLLSDDGTRTVNGIPAKQTPMEDRQFRSIWVKP